MTYHSRSLNSYRPSKTIHSLVHRGSGLIDMALKFINKRRPKIINDFITQNGNLNIIRIEVCRSPVQAVFTGLINAISLGRLNQNLKNKPYDELFHLYLVLTLSDGKQYLLEKNQRLYIGSVPKKTDKTECKEARMTGPILVTDFFTRAEQENANNPNFYKYSALGGANCQNYVRAMLNANNIGELDSFIMQDTKDLVPGYVRSISDKITNIAAIGDFIYRGGSDLSYKNNQK